MALTELSRQQIIKKRQEQAEKSAPAIAPQLEKAAVKKPKKESIFAEETEGETEAHDEI